MKVFCIFNEKKFDLIKNSVSLHHQTTAILPTKKNQKENDKLFKHFNFRKKHQH